MSKLTMEDYAQSVHFSVEELLKKRKITYKNIEQQLKEHPEFPSILSIYDTLRHYGTPEVEQVNDLSVVSKNLPSISYLKEGIFILLEEIDQEEVTYHHPLKGIVKESKEEFEVKWNGVMLHLQSSTFTQEVESPSSQLPVDAIYIIVLERNFEKNRKQILEQLQKIDVPDDVSVHFFKATDGMQIDTTELSDNDYGVYSDWSIDSENEWWNRPVKPGEIGCTLSHFLAWKDAKKKAYKQILVLEEDFHVLTSSFSVANTKEKWELFYLGRNRIHQDTVIPNHQGVVIPGYSYCSHAYMLNESGIEKLLRSGIEKNIIPVDEFLATLYCEHPRQDLRELFGTKLKTLALTENLIKQTSTSSTSTTEHIPDQQKNEEQWTPLHPELYKAYDGDFDQWSKKYFDPLLLAGEFDLITDEVAPNIYKFPLFTPIFCKELIEEAEHLDQWTYERHANYPTIDMLLETMHFERIYNFILQKYVMPLAIYKWQLEGKKWKQLDLENFIVKYDLERQGHLSLHHDHSMLTLNVCLNNEYEGGGTFFPKYNSLIKMKEPGHALLHPGQITHRHGARPITGGQRYIIVSFLR